MPSSPLGSTDGRTTTFVAFHHPLWTSSHSRMASGVACHYHPWTANTVERCRAWHAIITLGQHKRSNDVGRGMPSSPLNDKHGRTTSAVACHHHLWTAQTVGRRRAWHSFGALGRQTNRTTSGKECHHLLWAVRTVDIVGRGMPSCPLDTTHDRTKSVVACHHSP